MEMVLEFLRDVLSQPALFNWYYVMYRFNCLETPVS